MMKVAAACAIMRKSVQNAFSTHSSSYSPRTQTTKQVTYSVQVQFVRSHRRPPVPNTVAGTTAAGRPVSSPVLVVLKMRLGEARPSSGSREETSPRLSLLTNQSKLKRT